MKIELNHDLEDIAEIIATGSYTDLPDGVTVEDIQDMLSKFNKTFHAFEVGTLIAYLSIKSGGKITTMSGLMEFMVDDMGYENLNEFTTMMTASFDETVEAYNAEHEKQEAEEALEGDVGDVGDVDAPIEQ